MGIGGLLKECLRLGISCELRAMDGFADKEGRFVLPAMGGKGFCSARDIKFLSPDMPVPVKIKQISFLHTSICVDHKISYLLPIVHFLW